jgi:hypothetical protein
VTSRRLLTAALAIGTALLAALVWTGEGSERGERTSVDANVAPGEEQGFLLVDQYRDGSFTEGAFPFVKVQSTDGRLVTERLVRDARSTVPLLRQPVPAGSYRLVTYQRACEGACPRRGDRGLDPPTLRCEAVVEIAAGKTVTVLLRPSVARGCRVLIGERVGPQLARRQAFAACRAIAESRQNLNALAAEWRALTTQAQGFAASYAARALRGFDPSVRAAAAEGCAQGIGTVRHPIRFVVPDRVSVGQTVTVSITNVGTRAYLFEWYYQACFLSYLDSSGRRFIIPPGTHCDIRGKVPIRPGETKRLFSWRLDECTRDNWGCARSRVLPPGTYTITGRFRPVSGGPPVPAVTSLEIVAA